MPERQNKREQFQSKTSNRKKWFFPGLLLVLVVSVVTGSWLLLAQPSLSHKTVTAEQDGTLRFVASDLDVLIGMQK